MSNHLFCKNPEGEWYIWNATGGNWVFCPGEPFRQVNDWPAAQVSVKVTADTSEAIAAMEKFQDSAIKAGDAAERVARFGR